MTYNKDHISFLDLAISKASEGLLHTCVFRMETDRNTVLRAERFHPNWLKKRIFLLVNSNDWDCICDQEQDFEIQSKVMQNRFHQRGYKYGTINNTYSKEIE